MRISHLSFDAHNCECVNRIIRFIAFFCFNENNSNFSANNLKKKKNDTKETIKAFLTHNISIFFWCTIQHTNRYKLLYTHTQVERERVFQRRNLFFCQGAIVYIEFRITRHFECVCASDPVQLRGPSHSEKSSL